MYIGQIISDYLQENQMSQRQFAKRCGLSNGYISMLINNINHKTGKPLIPSLSALLSISKGFGMTFEELCNKYEDLEVDLSVAKNLPAATKGNGRVEEFVELFDKLTSDQQALIISQIKGILSNQ
jgi:transcriptional regulator with XRE-family HTH domain